MLGAADRVKSGQPLEPGHGQGTGPRQVAASKGGSRAALDGSSTRPGLLTVQDVAAYLAVSPWTIREWIAVGKLPAVRLPGRLVRVKRADLERLVEAWAGS